MQWSQRSGLECDHASSVDVKETEAGREKDDWRVAGEDEPVLHGSNLVLCGHSDKLARNLFYPGCSLNLSLPLLPRYKRTALPVLHCMKACIVYCKCMGGGGRGANR